VLPALAVHADWSVSPGKRWMSVAARSAAGWRVSCRPVGSVAGLLERLSAEANGGGVALGIDAALGVPIAYARQLETRAVDFPGFLAGLAADDALFEVCATIEDVSLARPFYPRGVQDRPRRLAHAARLGIGDPDALLRRCDRQTADRPRAAPLFWTLGANQVGKAALALWRELVLPALASSAQPLLWPFAGSLAELVRPGAVVIAETYPAQALRQLDLPLVGSKRRQAGRAALGPHLSARLAGLRGMPDPALADAIAAGFGADAAGEDRFDSLIGLLGLLHVLADPARDTVPKADPALRWEGWILGQQFQS